MQKVVLMQNERMHCFIVVYCVFIQSRRKTCGETPFAPVLFDLLQRCYTTFRAAAPTKPLLSTFFHSSSTFALLLSFSVVYRSTSVGFMADYNPKMCVPATNLMGLKKQGKNKIHSN
jgi:hypothetical protein